jgi:acyl carrier protein
VRFERKKLKWLWMPVQTRLLNCFRTIFPDEKDAVLLQGTPDQIAAWDSERHILLMNVIEETFSVTLPDNAADEFLSFEHFKNYLSSQCPQTE